MEGITFVYPNRTRPVSVTGNSCALDCAHCGGHYLRHMESQLCGGKNPKSAITSYLVSGGCDRGGAVPLHEHVPLLKGLSANHRVIAHTGLIKKEHARTISPYLDAASFNMIGDDSTISEVYGLDRTKEDFLACFNHLKEEVPTVAHITVGIHWGKVRGEYEAVDMIARTGENTLVFNVIIPTPKTGFEEVPPPPPGDVMEVISYAKNTMKDARFFIGCMRPKGKWRDEFDNMCVKNGIDRIVMPSKKALSEAMKLNLNISKSMECCIL